MKKAADATKPKTAGLTGEELQALGVQIVAPSKRRPQTTRVYGAPLSDEAIARIRARSKRP